MKLSVFIMLALCLATSANAESNAAAKGDFLGKPVPQDDCPYETVSPEEEKEVRDKEAEIRTRKEIKLSTKNSLMLVKICTSAGFYNELRHLKKRYFEEGKTISETYNSGFDVKIRTGEYVTTGTKLLVEEIAPTSSLLALSETALLGAEVVAKVVAGLGMGSCQENLSMWAKGYTHKERVDHFNKAFALELKRWTLKNPDSPACSKARLADSATAQFAYGILREQSIGASQIYEIYRQFKKGERPNFDVVDAGEELESVTYSPAAITSKDVILKQGSGSAASEDQEGASDSSGAQ